MDSSVGENLTSTDFTFFVGPDEVPCSLPSGALYNERCFSSKLIHIMKTAFGRRGRRAESLPDVDTETFNRFSEFVSSGDYTTPAPTMLTRPAAAAVASEEKPKKKRKTLPSPAESRLKDLLGDDAYEGLLEKRMVFPFPERDNMNSCSHDYTAVFLLHAKIYTFSMRYNIQKLSALALQKLKVHFDEIYHGIPKISGTIALIRHAYSDQNTPNEEGKIDPLRKLVVTHVAGRQLLFAESQEFKEILSEGGQFVQDLWELARAGKCGF